MDPLDTVEHQKRIKARASKLAPLQTFNSDTFRGSDEVPQELCNLVLAFAAVFNDCRDILYWMDELLAAAPETGFRINRYFGEHGGLMTHCFRLAAAMVHELGELMKKNGQWLNHPFFKDRVLSKLDRGQKERWEQVHALAHAKPGERAMDSLLKLLRDKETYHYDAAAMFPSFDLRFPSEASDPMQQPLVSNGLTIRGLRFYFADALAYAMLDQAATDAGLQPLGPKMEKVLNNVAVVLAKIVEAFIQARGPWRDFPEESLDF